MRKSTLSRCRWPFAALALLALLAGSCEDGDTAAPSSGATARFTAGVAAGDVTATTAVLWTRADGGDTPALDIATDEGMTRGLRHVQVRVSAESDWTVQAAVGKLKPATRYYYRFRAGDATSSTGTFTTPPGDDDGAGTGVRFVFSGDSDGTRRPDGTPPYNEFDVLRRAKGEHPAFFLYFGDTIHADRDPIASTLDGYRAKYRENRGYSTLTDILAAAPVYTMWDDHEVVNDFGPQSADTPMIAAGRQAFREYLPIGDTGNPARLYRAFHYGRDIDLIILDERSYRDASAAQACAIDGNPDPLPAGGLPGATDALRAVRGVGGLPATVSDACASTLSDPARSLLGAEQLAWLKDRLAKSTATWKIVVNPVPLQSLFVLPYDRWEGYAAERESLLRFLRDESIANVVFLTTDFHATVFGPVRDGADSVAYEAVTGPIATAPLAQEIRSAVGSAAADILPGFLSGIAGVDCSSLDTFSYGVAELTPDGRTLTIASKDAQGQVLCAKTLEAQ